MSASSTSPRRTNSDAEACLSPAVSCEWRTPDEPGSEAWHQQALAHRR